MENSRRAVAARVDDLPALIEAYPKADDEKMPDYWARLHQMLNSEEKSLADEVRGLSTKDELRKAKTYDGYKPTKAHLNFTVDPVKPKADHQPMTMSGFCMWPGLDNHGHALCYSKECRCNCHEEV